MTRTLGSIFHRIRVYLELIKIEHIIFDLPFLFISALLAANGIPSARTIFYILVAMFGAWGAAMAFNRIVDYHYDKLNPRTADRALPKGQISMLNAWIFTIISSFLLVFSAWRLNAMSFILSPIALIIVLGYSYTKRFTTLSHLILGLANSIAPVGAWVAITGRIGFPSMILSAAVTFWIGGFDVLYALQDIDFDKKTGLFSIPQTYGIKKSLHIARLMHLFTVLLFVWFGISLHLGFIYYIGIFISLIVLIYEHSLIKHDDLSKVPIAFFQMNAIVGITFFVFSVLDFIYRNTIV